MSIMNGYQKEPKKEQQGQKAAGLSENEAQQ